jgi:BirA family biotin operon repressor/biotin-[acetyl-CoA-carboxylase] ligase
LPPENPIGEPFIQLGEVESSNNYAIRQVHAHLAEHGATWFAIHQTAGKGQRGKAWNDEPGQNIIMSSVLTLTTFSIRNQFALSAMAALGCRDFFAVYAGEETKIKWPNDLYWRDKKAGGILIENVLKGANWKFSVIGIGININQTLFPPFLANAVSLKQITGKTFNVVKLAKELCTCLEKRWQQLIDNQDTVLEEYCDVLYKKGQRVTFKKDNARFEATVLGVNLKGELIIDTGIETAVQMGAVEWVMS